jgi:lipid II:glycine glycyltransferase (peptidoglycan interpeptide bridge formation enzyme)
MTNKEQYEIFCENESDMPIYSKPYWLDAVCQQGSWDVILIHKNGKIIASMPYQIRKRLGYFRIISMPQLTQTMGPYIKYPAQQRYSKRLHYEKEIMYEIIEKLPKFDKFIQTFHYDLTNWLPFYWRNFTQSTKYTYCICKEKSLEEIFAGFSHANRSQIRKAQKYIRIVESDDLNKLYGCDKMTFNRQHLPIAYSYEYLQKIDTMCKKHQQRKILFALDDDGRTHTGIYLIWDARSVYFIISGSNPQLRNSGAHNLIVWHAIKFAHKKGLDFDFEGSMIHGVERFIRGFGAIQKPYFEITKINSNLLRLQNLFYDLFRSNR